VNQGIDGLGLPCKTLGYGAEGGPYDFTIHLMTGNTVIGLRKAQANRLGSRHASRRTASSRQQHEINQRERGTDKKRIHKLKKPATGLRIGRLPAQRTKTTTLRTFNLNK